MASRTSSAHVFAGEGELQALGREKDWSETPLGPVETWSMALRSTVRTILASPFPTNLWCGEELVLIYNDAYRKVLGAKHPWALGRPGFEVWSEIWDDIGPMFEQIRAGGPPVYAEDEPFFVERGDGDDVRVGPDEPNAWFTFSLSPVRDEEGSIVAFLNVVSETTDRVLARRREEKARASAERAEARLLQVFERAPAFLAVLRGPDHVFEYVNDAYRELVGERNLIGRPVFEALPEVQRQGFEELLDGVLETGEPFVGHETPIELARGPGGAIQQRYLDFVYYPLEEPEGRFSGVIAHGYDVTDHVRAREAAERARAEAEEANEAKTEFLRTMSHDFRTPINAILGYTELLSDEIPGPLNEAQRVQLERVRASTRHLNMLAGDVLDLARVEAGEVELELERLPVTGTVNDAVSLVRPQAREHGVEVDAVCGCDDGDVHYHGDDDRVRQILVNLLSNAVQFTPSGGEVRVTCGTSSAPDVVEDGPGTEEAGGGEPRADVPANERGRSASGVMTFVRVRDTGVGIAPGDMQRIFEPFTRGAEETRDDPGGTGLGLTIARELAELMGGAITVESSAGEGSTFTLWLPR